MFCWGFVGQSGISLGQEIDKELFLHKFMVARSMVFGDVITSIKCPWAPIHIKLILGYAVLYLMKPHVDRLGTFLLHGFFHETQGGLVVNFYGGGGVRIAPFVQTHTEK